ncbi:putative Protein QmcA [Paratrimastix pyriformis]|uniref:Band 7 domain-containing protein n=1 Tax=Paratrimastix pyriformis TaxID=342808 RepID=A0ABQ8UQP2_9EUKA|nr:putative Protein QmcA [Paratrimastix pyriformis]
MGVLSEELQLTAELTADELSGGEIGGIIGFFAAFVVVFIITCCCCRAGVKVVHQAQVMVVERWGKFHRILKPGIHFINPIFDRPRKIHWKYVNVPIGTHTEAVVTQQTDRVDMREHCIDFGKQNVITKDTVCIEIDALVYYQVTSPIRAVYHIQNLPDAIELLTQTTLRNIIAHLTLDETFSSREQINSMLQERTQEDAGRWGVSIIRVEIQDIMPPSDIKTAMENQIIGERERRSAVLQADGERESQIIRSRGEAAQIVLRAEGEKTARIQLAKGEAEAKLTVANAEASCIKALRDAMEGSRVRATDYLVAMQYLSALPRLVMGSHPTRAILLPQETVDDVSSLLNILPQRG